MEILFFYICALLIFISISFILATRFIEMRGNNTNRYQDIIVIYDNKDQIEKLKKEIERLDKKCEDLKNFCYATRKKTNEDN